MKFKNNLKALRFLFVCMSITHTILLQASEIEDDDITVVESYYAATTINKLFGHRYEDVQQVLHDHPESVNYQNGTKATPLLHAIALSYHDIAELLLHSGADPNVGNDNGDRPLHVAVFYSDYESAKLLISHGADISLQNTGRNSPLSMINDCCDSDMADIILSNY